MNARAVILAAGRGSRLGEETLQRPKALAMLGGRSLLEWKRMALAAVGIEEIHAVAGYRAEAVAATGMDTLRNERWAETNMVSTLLCADRILSQPGRTLVCYGDVVFHPTIAGRLLSASEDLVISYDVRWLQLWKARFDQPLSDAESFRESEGWLVDIGRKVDRLDEVGGQFMGLLLMSQQGWASVRTLLASLQPAEVERLDTTALLRRLLHAGERIRALAVEGRWCEVDTQADLDGYERQLGQAGWSHDWRWQSER